MLETTLNEVILKLCEGEGQNALQWAEAEGCKGWSQY